MKITSLLKRITPAAIILSNLMFVTGSFANDLQDQMQFNIATPENLADFELIEPVLTPEEQEEARLAELAEQSGEFDKLGADLQGMIRTAPQKMFVSGKSNNVTVEIYLNSKAVGKQFLVARQFGQIRYVFAVSGGGNGRSTPAGTFGVTGAGQLWRHMSSTYPSAGENNMDHVTYFAPAVGFHSTVFGLFSKLGRADSHGCVRLARPEARKIYALIKNNGAAATIYSLRNGDPQASDLGVIKSQLAKDLNFIQSLIKNRTRADVPMNESQYMSYVNGQMDRATLNEILKRNKIKNLIEIPSSLDLGPRGPNG